MKEPLVSVIVPVYNVSRYLKRCLDSITSQTYKNLDIILVDDGSKDDSGVICDEYARTDSRIKVIHKENGGLSDARNVGLDVMEGDYVTFVDSDDWMELNAIERLYTIMTECCADISCISFNKVFEKEKKKVKSISTAKREIHIYKGTEAIERIMYKKGVDTSAWGKLYKKSDFDCIRYPKGVIFEDLATTYRIFYGKERIAYSNEKMYNYLQRDNSIMYQRFSRKRFDRIDIGREMMEWARNKEPELRKAAETRYFIANIQLFREMPLTNEWENDLNDVLSNIKKYRRAVIRNRKAKMIDRLIALSTCLGVRPLKAIGKIYKIVWP